MGVLSRIKITVGQVAASLLDVNDNSARILELLDEASGAGSKVLVLPELYLTGYDVRDAISTEQGAEKLEGDIKKALSKITKKTAECGCDLLLSYPLFEDGDKKPYIALDYFSNGKSIALHRKINLCNYAQYTEHLTFREGDEVTVADAPHFKTGMFVCEDLWHVTNAIFAAKLGAEVIFYPSAATVVERSDVGACLANWKKLTQGTAFSQTSYVVCCNAAESKLAMGFGGSHVVAPDGEIIAELPLFEEAITHVDIDLGLLRKIREMRPLLKNERFEVYKKYMD